MQALLQNPECKGTASPRSFVSLYRERSIFLLPLVHPSSRFAKIEKAIMTQLDGTYTAFIVPIGFAYASLASWNKWCGLDSAGCQHNGTCWSFCPYEC